MALSKIFTVGNVVNTVLLWLKQEMQHELEPNLVRNFANLAVIEEAEKVSVHSDDYGKTADVTDAASNVSTTIITGANYVDSTRVVTKATHGLVTADVGKRIILQTATRVGIAWIESITDDDNFVVTNAFGVDIADNSLSYIVLSHHSTSTIDLSSYKIMNIVKLYSSVHKEIPKLGDIEADNIERNDFKVENKVYWYKHGEFIFLVVPSGVSIGSLKLFYNSYPEKKTLDTEYFDIRDNYIPQVIKRTKIYCLDHLGLTPPASLDQVIEAESKSLEKTAGDRRVAIAAENKDGIDG